MQKYKYFIDFDSFTHLNYTLLVQKFKLVIFTQIPRSLLFARKHNFCPNVGAVPSIDARIFFSYFFILSHFWEKPEKPLKRILSDILRSVYLKIDVGYHRAGIPNENSNQILEVAEILAEHSSAIEFQGLYAHCGNSYQASNDDEVKQARDEAISKLDKVAQMLQDSGHRLLVKHQGTVF